MKDICSIYVLNTNKLLNQQNMVPQFTVGLYVTYIVNELNIILPNLNMKKIIKECLFRTLSQDDTEILVIQPAGMISFY